MMSRLGLVTLFMAWILSAIASLTDACTRHIVILLGSISSIFPWCGMKSMCILSMYVYL